MLRARRFVCLLIWLIATGTLPRLASHDAAAGVPCRNPRPLQFDALAPNAPPPAILHDASSARLSALARAGHTAEALRAPHVRVPKPAGRRCQEASPSRYLIRRTGPSCSVRGPPSFV